MTPNGLHVRKKIAQLPKAPDEIAKVLERERVTGQPGNPCSCVLANYLSRDLPQPGDVRVSKAGIYAYEGLDYGADCTITNLSPGLMSFIAAFDDRQYPALIAGGGTDAGRNIDACDAV